MKKAKYNFEEPDLSRWHILTYDELLKVNGGSGNDSGDDGESEDDDKSGGHEIENTVEAVANAEVGDTLTRDDGTQVTITQGDIDWAQEHCGSYGKSGEEEKEESPAKESDLPSAEEADCSKTEQEEGGSRRIENTDEAVANAKPGDTLVRDDGTVVTLKEIDIEQAQEKLGIGEHKEDEKSPSKEGELAEKSSGENKNAKGENAANLPSDYKNYPVSPDYSEERAYINSKLDTPKGNNVKIVEEHYINRHGYVPMENIGINGGTNYHVTSVRTDDHLSVFATGHFLGENLVNNYTPYGTVALIVDGNKVQSQSFTRPSSPFVWDGQGKVLGDANFDYDFANAENITLDFNFGVVLTQDSQTFFKNYGDRLVNIK